MELNSGSIYLKAVIEKVLSIENNDARFEAFCNAVVSVVEGGAIIIGTTASWDMGRDGIGLGRARGIYLCTSLRDDIDAKLLSDLKRITDTTKDISRLYFCSSHRVSEYARDKYSAQLIDEAGFDFPVTCFGASQLAEISSDSPVIVERYYQAEIDDVNRVISANQSEGAEVRGLRLALISSAAEDSFAIREGIYSASLLDLMKNGNRLTLSKCCKALADSLHLNRNLAPETLQPHLSKLLNKGLIGIRDGVYSITENGLIDVRKREQDGVGRLLSLRRAVRESIEDAIGEKIVDDEYSRIWTVFEERMTHYFLSRGEELVTEISELLGTADFSNVGEGVNKNKLGSTLSFLDELAQSVGNASSHPSRRIELTQAVKDIFTDRSSPAAEWLVRIAASFLAACALGLENSSSIALKNLLARTRLVLDTDVVLSLLGEGEPEHVGVDALVDRWKRMGGTNSYS